MCKRVLFSILAFIFAPVLCAVELNYPQVIHKYRMQDGLSNDVVYDICQDSNECIWFATAEGISKFDGSEFSSYNWNILGNKAHTGSALKILELKNKLYIATSFGFVVYDLEIKKFKVFQSLENQKIRALAYARDGNLWVGAYDGGGVYKFDIQTQSFTQLQYNWKDNRILSLYEDKQGSLYIGTHFGGMDVVDLKTNQTTHYDKTMPGMPDNQVENIFEDSLGNIWIGTWNGLVLLNKNTQQLKRYDNGVLKNCQVNAITEDEGGNLWVGTETGLISFNIREALVDPLSFKQTAYYESRDEYGLSYKTILALHRDFNNNIWIGTNSGGVNLISNYQPLFDRILYDPRLENSLSYRRVMSVSEDRIGNLWIATDGGGVNYYDKLSKKITYLNKSNSDFKDNAILCSLVDSDGDAWFGTYNNMLYQRIENTKKINEYKGSETYQNALFTGDIICLEEDAYKRIWIGQRSGLVCYDKKGNAFSQISPFRWVAVNCLLANKDGMYIGTDSKLYYYDFVTQQISVPNPLFENLHPSCFYIDNQSNLWIGTRGLGLYRYSIKNGSLENFNMQSGFPSNNVCKIIEDDDQNLWVTTTKGLSKFSKKNNEIRNYGSEDGIQPGMFIENSGVKTRSGQIIFGGTEGLTLFYPAEVKEISHNPKIIFTNFLLFNNPVEVKSESNPHSPLTKDINYVDEIVLNYDESVFSIEYTAVDYRSPNRINYAYILEGVDKDWNFVKDKKTATYRYLKSGAYTFKVIASGFDGSFDFTKYRSIKIVVNPPYYLTWWAFIIYVIIIGALCYIAWNVATISTRSYNRIRQERLRHKESEELYQEKIQFFTNISHEFRTPLTLIAAPVDRLLKDETSEEKKYLLSLIKRNVVRMLNNVSEIMDIRKIDREQMKLKVEELDIIPFVGEIIDLFQNLAHSKSIELEYSHGIESYFTWVDPEFLDKILYNILSNAIKFTPNHGEIIVNLFIQKEENIDDSRLCIEITDTGTGIAKENLSLIFDRFYQVKNGKTELISSGSGVGLHLVKSLVELHKGSIVVNSKVGVGSVFSLSLPFTSGSYELTEKTKTKTERANHHTDYISAIAETPETAVHPENLNNEQRSKILIIDDETEILNYLKFELSNEYDVILAENGHIGLEKAYQIIPDLIISDVMMPGLDGISVSKELKANINTSHIPIILLTAKSSIDDRIEGLEVGAESFITKPFDSRHLRVRIKKLIELRALMQAKHVEKLSNPNIGKLKGMSPIDEQLLRRITKYILDNISNSDINGETIAKHIAMTRMSLHRKLKALTGLSAGDFIRNIRLEEAKKLLETGGRTVSEVSYDVGYSSPSYFYTCFVRKFGVPPSDINKI